MAGSLLEDIQNSAIDAECDLGTILRKCKLLAARLDSKPLEEWLIWESNGYPSEQDVPDYRIWQTTLKGHFSGYFGSGLNNALIPMACLPESHRDAYERYKCRQSIAALEALLKTGGHSFRVGTGDLSLVLGGNVYENMNCLQSWAEVASGAMVEVLNAVRNRVLDLSLAIWKASPSAGESGATGTDRMDTAQITQIFQTTVYGGSATVLGRAENSSVTTVLQGNAELLRAVLSTQGLPPEDIDGLQKAIASDPQTPGSKLGPKVAAWLGSMAEKAAEGALKAGGTLALKHISEAIARYYGIPL